MTERPPMLGLRHLALYVADAHFDATIRFYTEGLGLGLDWQPDPDNVYLSGGHDNLAIHRAPPGQSVSGAGSPLDHLGFAMPDKPAVLAWHAYLEPRASTLCIELLTMPREHRDGSTSFYLRDPAGHKVQLLHVPSLRP